MFPQGAAGPPSERLQIFPWIDLPVGLGVSRTGGMFAVAPSSWLPAVTPVRNIQIMFNNGSIIKL